MVLPRLRLTSPSAAPTLMTWEHRQHTGIKILAQTTRSRSCPQKGTFPKLPGTTLARPLPPSANLTYRFVRRLLSIVAGSGGASTLVYQTFDWQVSVPESPADEPPDVRNIPDVSLFASDGLQSQSFYVVCQADALCRALPATLQAPLASLAQGNVGLSAELCWGLSADRAG